MSSLVQPENVALFAVILGPFADCPSSLTIFLGGEARTPVKALLHQKGDMVLGLGESIRNSLALTLKQVLPSVLTDLGSNQLRSGQR